MFMREENARLKFRLSSLPAVGGLQQSEVDVRVQVAKAKFGRAIVFLDRHFECKVENDRLECRLRERINGIESQAAPDMYQWSDERMDDYFSSGEMMSSSDQTTVKNMTERIKTLRAK